MSIQSIELGVQIYRHNAKKAFSFWRREIEARQTFGNVVVTAELRMSRDTFVSDTAARIETVVDNMYGGTLAIVSTKAINVLPIKWDTTEEDYIYESGGIPDDKTVYIPVFLPKEGIVPDPFDGRTGLIAEIEGVKDPLPDILQEAIGLLINHDLST